MFITDFPNSIDTIDNLLKTTNRALGVLKFPMSPIDLSFELIDGSLFPLGAQLITIENEIIACSSRTGNIFTVAQRGFLQTITTSHDANKKASINFTSHHWNNMIDSIINMQTFIMSGSPSPTTVNIQPNTIETIRSISNTGFSDIDFEVKIIEETSNEIIKFNLRIVKSPTILKNTIYGKVGTFSETEINLNIIEGPTDIIIQLENLRLLPLNVLVTNEI